MDGRPNRRNKAAFSNFSGVVCTGPEIDGPRHLQLAPEQVKLGLFFFFHVKRIGPVWSCGILYQSSVKIHRTKEGH